MKTNTDIPPPLHELCLDDLSSVIGGDADPGGDVLGSTFQEPDHTFGQSAESLGTWG
jgi:hypothetical protein